MHQFPSSQALVKRNLEDIPIELPSGEHTKNNGKLPFIVDFPMKNGGSFHGKLLVHQRVLSLTPEGFLEWDDPPELSPPSSILCSFHRLESRQPPLVTGPACRLDPDAVASGEHTNSNGKSAFFMGKSTISMAIFNCFLYVHGYSEGSF